MPSQSLLSSPISGNGPGRRRRQSRPHHVSETAWEADVPGVRYPAGYCVCSGATELADPRAGNLRIAKQVLIYLKGTITLGIMWSGDPADHLNKYQPLGVVGYADNNFAGDANDRKSVTWYCFIGGATTTWCSKRQRKVSPSTSEAEYVAMSHGARVGVWVDDS